MSLHVELIHQLSMHVIPAKPHLQIPLDRSAPPSSFGDETFFSYSGTSALILLLKHLNILPGSSILLPAYCCAELSHALLSYHYHLFFIDSAKLHPWPSTQILTGLLHEHQPSAYISVSYFGFIPPSESHLQTIVKDYGCVYISDRCHSYLSHVSTCSSSHAFYSYRKTLAIPTLGSFELSPDEGPVPKPSFSSYPLYLQFKSFISLFLHDILTRQPFLNPYRLLHNIRSHLSYLTSQLSTYKISPSEPICLLQSSLILPPPAPHTHISRHIAFTRRSNFLYYLSLLSERQVTCVLPLFRELPVDVVPQAFPVLTTETTLLTYLIQNCIGVTSWPGTNLDQSLTPASLYPNSHQLNKQVILLPLHQSISEDDISRIINIILAFEELPK